MNIKDQTKMSKSISLPEELFCFFFIFIFFAVVSLLEVGNLTFFQLSGSFRGVFLGCRFEDFNLTTFLVSNEKSLKLSKNRRFDVFEQS